MVGKFICSFIIINLYAKESKPDFLLRLNNLFIQSSEDNNLFYNAIVETMEMINCNNIVINNLKGILKYMGIDINFVSKEIKSQDLSSNYNISHSIFYETEFKFLKFNVLINKAKLIYDINNPEEFILTILPNYLLQYDDWIITGQRSIKMKGFSAKFHKLFFAKGDILKGSLDGMFIDFNKRVLNARNLRFNFLEDGNFSLESMESNDFDNAIQMNNLNVHNGNLDLQCFQGIVKVPAKIIVLNNIEMVLGNIFLIPNEAYIDLETFRLYYKDLKLFLNNEKVSVFSEGYIDLRNPKLYVGKGEVYV